MDLFDRFLQETTYLKGISPDTIRYYGCVRRTLASILSEPTKAGMLACVQKLVFCVVLQKVSTNGGYIPSVFCSLIQVCGSQKRYRLRGTLCMDFDNLVIKVRGKGGKHRLVPFSVECRRVLFRYLSRQEMRLVFATRSGLVFGKRR